MNKRLLTIILTALLLLPALAACGESPANADPAASPETVPASVTPAEAEAEEEEDPEAALYKDLPAGDYNGRTFTILAPGTPNTILSATSRGTSSPKRSSSGIRSWKTR